MQKVGENTYKCSMDEWIQLNFEDSIPGNATIRRQWDREPIDNVNQTFLRKQFKGTQRVLTLSVSFTAPGGSCGIAIGNGNSVVDKDLAQDTGDVTVKVYTFIP